MLDSKNRLRKKKSFERVYKSGRLIKQDFLLIKVLKNNKDASRIGIVISKKVLAKATARNLVKRRIREAVREILPRLSDSLDIVIIVQQKSVIDKSFNEIKEAIEKAFVSINL